jgi:hypothetical protein
LNAKQRPRDLIANGRAKGTSMSPRERLLLPGALLMAIRAQLLAPFMFVDFGFPSLLQ